MALYPFLFTGFDMKIEYPQYLDADIAHYKKSSAGLSLEKRRPTKHICKNGLWFPLEQVSWNIPWYIVELTMDDEKIRTLNNDIQSADTRTRSQSPYGNPGKNKGKIWRTYIKRARKDYLEILLNKQKEGKILCVASNKVFSRKPGNLIEIIKERNKYYIASLGGVKVRRYCLSLKEIEGISWLKD